MNIFCDLHHFDLYYSLQLFFEKRMGWCLYRPIGLEWYHEGYWNVFPHIDTARQYLALDQAINQPKDTHDNYLDDAQCMNKNYTFEDGIYYVVDGTLGKVHRAVTLDKFKEMKFDIIISSIPQHIGPFNKLIQLYQKDAKHIFQVGNAWGHQPGVRNILASTAPFPVPSNVNACFYHQEFSLEKFKYVPPTNHKRAHSYIHYMREPEVLVQYKQALPDWTFKTYGAGMDECLHKVSDIAQAYIDSGWTYHVKPEGDGYGYGLHRAAACGRPPIVKANYYQGKLAGRLMQDMVTCIDISKRSVHENSQILQRLSQPEEHLRMAENAHRLFKEVVDFDREEIMIREFLSRLL